MLHGASVHLHNTCCMASECTYTPHAAWRLSAPTHHMLHGASVHIPLHLLSAHTQHMAHNTAPADRCRCSLSSWPGTWLAAHSTRCAALTLRPSPALHCTALTLRPSPALASGEATQLAGCLPVTSQQAYLPKHCQPETLSTGDSLVKREPPACYPHP